jgi:hypothetical protein
MDYFNQNKPEIFTLEVDESTKSTLLEMSRWTKFLAILGFVMLGLMILAGIILGIVMTQYTAMAAAIPGIGSSAILLIYVVLAALYFYPTFALYKYSTGMKAALNNNDKPGFNKALVYLKNMFKYIGIIMIVILCLYGLIIIFGVITTIGKI